MLKKNYWPISVAGFALTFFSLFGNFLQAEDHQIKNEGIENAGQLHIDFASQTISKDGTLNFASHHKSSKKKPKSINLRMALSFIPDPRASIPEGFNIDITPFAISPLGKLYEGQPTNVSIVDTRGLIIPLNEVFVSKEIEGTYTVGCTISLGQGSPASSGFPAAFNVVVLNDHVWGLREETVNSTSLSLALSDLQAPTDFITVTSNTQLIRSRPCKEKFKRFDQSVSINMQVTISSVTGTFNLTPFAKAPNGRVYRGFPTTVVGPIRLPTVDLNPVNIPKPLTGNYFAGVEISLAGIPSTEDFNNVFLISIKDNPVGLITETTNSPLQTLPLGALMNASDFFRVTTNFQIVKF